MSRGNCLRFSAAVVVFLNWAGIAAAASAISAQNEDAWNSAHLRWLPPELQARAIAVARRCGEPPQALHQFGLSINAHGVRAIVLHFDQLRCGDKAAVCTAAGCLHEVYVAHGTERYRRVFRAFVRDLALENASGVLSLRFICANASACPTMVWTGKSFERSYDAPEPNDSREW